MARTTLRRWAESRGHAHATATKWRHKFDDFPEPTEREGMIYFYDDRKLDAFMKAHPTLGQGRSRISDTPPE